MEAQVNWNDIKSCKFKINNGVKQGGVISPLLFVIYADVLINKLILYNTGCRVGNISACVMMYADDIILLSPTRTSMQELLNICEDYGREYHLVFNAAKSEVIIFGTTFGKLELLLNGKLIPVVDKIKHLGHLISNKDRNFYNCVDIIKDLKVRCNTISCNFNFLTTSSRMKIFNTNCYCFYGCPC